MKHAKTLLIASIISFLGNSAFSQDLTNSKFGKGIGIAARDSSFTMKFSTRMQTLYQGELNTSNQDYNDGFQIRRFRLKFDGIAYSPRLQYKIELAISNTDINGGAIPQSGNTSNIVLDALLKWNFTGKWSLWFGQTKLPGNRERVISSQNLQFVDRSNVNSRFNLDRDAGIQLHYNGSKLNLIGAVTMGEGRNIIADNAGGYDYTARVEYLPFGKFKDKGDYFSADLRREETPKLSLAASYDFNNGASRERGQLGEFMPVNRDLETWFADAHFKYRGFSSLIEYAHRVSPDGPVVQDTDGSFLDAFYTGDGISAQAGYLLPMNLEFAGRYTVVTPEAVTLRNKNEQFTFGVSRYFVDHSLKIQSDITLIEEDSKDDILMFRFQVELGF